MTEENGASTIVSLPDGDGGQFSFKSLAAFLQWIEVESARWNQMLTSSVSSSGDPAGEVGKQGATEHAQEWTGLVENAKAQKLDKAEIINETTAELVSGISERINSRNLIISTSNVGRRVIALCESDFAVGQLAISLTTGRNITRVLAPNNLKPLWRSLTRLIAGFNTADESVGVRASEALRSAELNAAEISAKEQSLSQLLDSVRESIATESQLRHEELLGIFASVSSEAQAKLDSIDTEWKDLRATYDTKLALKAPRDYWHRRRIVHRWGAALWGVAALIVVSLTAAVLVPKGAALVASSKFLNAAQTIGGNADLSVLMFLPEIFQIAVVGFLILWGLRFAVRQTAENLARLEEASQRVTMVETFLAFSSPGDGQEAVVGDADRAVIVQALFRASSHGQIDDAPPAHWIEDVFRRLRGGDTKK